MKLIFRIDDLICNNTLQTIQFYPKISTNLDDKIKLNQLMDYCNKNLEITGLTFDITRNTSLFPERYGNHCGECVEDLIKRSHQYHVYKLITNCLTIKYNAFNSNQKIWYRNLHKQHATLLEYSILRKKY